MGSRVAARMGVQSPAMVSLRSCVLGRADVLPLSRIAHLVANVVSLSYGLTTRLTGPGLRIVSLLLGL